MKYQHIIVTGSISYDHIMKMPDTFKDHIMPDKIHILNVSFLVNEFRKEYGGTAPNVSYNLSLFGIPSTIVTSAGSDFSEYKNHLSNLPYIDISEIKIFKNTTTSQGFVITDSEDNQIWGFFQGAMKNNYKLKLKHDTNLKEFLLIGPDIPKAMINFANQAIRNKIDYMFDPAFNIPHLKKEDLIYIIKHCHILIGNDYEIEQIKRKIKFTHSKLSKTVPIIITTLGSEGSLIFSRDKRIKIKPAIPKNESDPTGAGDAYRAGFLAGYINRKDLKTCGQMGSVCSVYTVEKYGTQTHKFTLKSFSKRYYENYKENLS